MNNFRSISDEIMKDIVVTSELKEKTLRNVKQNNALRNNVKRNKLKPVIGVLVPAACVAIAIAAVNLSNWWLTLEQNVAPKNNSEVTLMMESAQGLETQPRDNTGRMQKAEDAKSVEYTSADEAKKAFGAGLLIPEFIPDGFEMTSSSGMVTDNNAAVRVVFNYASHIASFQIIEEKTKPQIDYSGYKTVNINGISGHLKTEIVTEEGGMYSQFTEVHWLRNGRYYSVAGQISEDMALKVAGNMK